MKEGEEITISFEITNTGNYDGKEIVQLYVRDKIASVPRPIKDLKGFQKVALQKGASKTVQFTLSSDDLKFYDQQMKYVVEPGEFEVMIGASSDDIRLHEPIKVVE